MSSITITIDGAKVTTNEGTSVLDAARNAGIYIPTLCSHPDLPPAGQCKLCIVEVEGPGELVTACETIAVDGMAIGTKSTAVQNLRRDNLALILANHPHACLTCAQREGCSRTQCSSNVPVPERCCVKFGNCEVRKVSDYIGIKPDTPRYVHAGLPIRTDEPLIRRDTNLCIDCNRCVRVCKEVRGVGAIASVEHDGRKYVDAVASTLKESACRFCTACVDVCPTGALLDKTISLARQEAEVVPCRANCPAGIDIPRYLRYVAEGKFPEATAVIRERVPFPEVLGTVCFHPCEGVCRRGEVSDPVAICSLKRFAAEHDDGLWKANSKVAPSTGKKVAVIGSGPAGLTAAYYLAKAGHSVTVFESLPEPGGMLRVGIPAYRLPRKILDKEINEILAVGVELKTNSPIGDGRSLDDLKAQGYHATFLAVGAHKPKKLDVPGETLDGVVDCVDLLRAFSLGQKVKVGKKAIVVGGGNAAIDAARTALRLGAKDVSICYRRTAKEMPANKSEIEDALGEGIKIEHLVSPVRILGSDKVSSIEFIRMDLAGIGPDGRIKTSPIAGSEFSVDADMIITAIGQESDLAFLGSESNIKVARGAVAIDEATMMTAATGVFAGGDAVKSPGSVIEAIAAGRRAASAIDEYLGGGGDIQETLIEFEQPDMHIGRIEGFGDKGRVPMPCLAKADRCTNFDQVELGYDADMAIAEAKRCLQCDLRLLISEAPMPPDEWLEFNKAQVSVIPAGIDGVYQLLDENKEVLKIKGTQNLREALEEQLGSNNKAKYFHWEEDMMYTKRESELISMYLQEHGKMPEGDDELEDLF